MDSDRPVLHPSLTTHELTTLLDQAFDPDRRFLLQGNKYYSFYCGRHQDGGQAIITHGMELKFTMHFFDAKGDLIGIERRTFPLSAEPEEAYLRINDDELHAFLALEYGLYAETVRVKRVTDPDAEFSIEPLTGYMMDFLTDPFNDFTDDDRQTTPERIREWISNGEFVFNCYNDYWVDGTGEVTSS